MLLDRTGAGARLLRDGRAAMGRADLAEEPRPEWHRYRIRIPQSSQRRPAKGSFLNDVHHVAHVPAATPAAAKTGPMPMHELLGTDEWRLQDGQNETEQPDHSASLGDSTTSSTRIRFSVNTGGRLRPRAPSSADFTTTTAGFEFSVHTAIRIDTASFGAIR